MSTNTFKTITQTLLLSVIALLPFVKIMSLYFPFISGKAYLFRFLVALAFFFWMWLIIENQKSKIKNQNYFTIFKNILVAALVLFFLAQALVSLFAVDPFYSFFSSIDRGDGVFQYGFWILYFLMLTSVFRQEADWKKLFSVFIIVAVALSIYSFLDLGSGQPKFSGLFGNPAYFGAFLLFAAGFSLLLYENRSFNSKSLNNLLLSLAGFFVLTLILTNIRGVYAGLAAGIFLFCALSFLFLRRENRALANRCGIILIAGILFLTALFSARHTDFVKNIHILSRITEVADVWEVASTRERLLNWSIALKAFAEKPIFGWGPENYGVAANKYYDFRIGESEPWFDRAHSQPLDTLATGGIVLFSFYVLWIFAVFFLIFKISREKKILSFILASIFLAYLIQGFFLFDTLAVYLGLFPFLAYLVYLTRINADKERIYADNIRINQLKSASISVFILAAAEAFSLFIIYTTVIVPWRANNAAWQFFNLTEQGFYKEAKPYLQKAFSINSPYTSWELRKMTAWQFMNVLESKITEKTEPKKIEEVQDLYDFLIPELEKHITARLSHPQMYHILATIYRLGFEKLGKNDLEKAEVVLKKAFNYSDRRAEYFNDFAKVSLLQGKFEEAEKVIKAHAERMPPEWGKPKPFVTLGNFYFEAKKYEKTLEYYDKARQAGFQVHKNEAVYPRYMLAAEALRDYERIVDMAQKYLEFRGPEPDTYFNLAVGYLQLQEKEKAREFFLKAVELKPEEYEQYRAFFIE